MEGDAALARAAPDPVPAGDFVGGRIVQLEVRREGGRAGGGAGARRASRHRAPHSAAGRDAASAGTPVTRLGRTRARHPGRRGAPRKGRAARRARFADQPPPPSPPPQVEDFKSYGGRQTIGPFAGFTAVVGPNGSGKSNLMDAASFVLGVRARQLRGALRDLVHTGAKESGGAAPTRAAVELVFRPEAGDDVRFGRVVVAPPTGPATSHYTLDGRTVTWDAYDAKLKAHGILVRARNFLVFQGDIEAVASMSPTGLTDMFEVVSGSGALKAAYEAAEAAKAAAEEAAAVAFSKKRATAAERRQKKDQKEEAEKYLRLRAEVDELKATHALLALAGANRAARAAREAGATARARLADVEAEKAAADADADAARREAAAAHRERMTVERGVNARRAALERAHPDALRKREEASRLARREAELEAAAASAAKALGEQRAAVARLTASLAQTDDAVAAAAADADAGVDAGLGFDAATQDEFFGHQARARAATDKLRTTADRARGERRAHAAALDALQAKLARIDEQRAAHEADAAAAEARGGDAAAAARTARADLDAKRAAAAAAVEDARRATAKRDDAEARLAAVEESLRDARAERRETERDRRVADAVAHMATLLPGVRGRVTDLATAAQRRHHLALAVVLGKDMDSVVVDSEATAKECIAYLKSARLPPLTFIPVDTVRAKPVNERLRALGGSAKLALDLLTYEPGVERAVRAVCGDTLVCDSVDEARALAFAGPERHKVVALDGTMISRAGLITGGVTASMESRAARWDDRALGELKAERAALGEALAALPRARDAAAAADALKADVAGLEHEVALKAADVQASAAKAKEAGRAAAALERERARSAADEPALRAALDAADAQLADVTARINEIEDRVFSAFSKRVGVPNVREAMEAVTARASAATATRGRLQAQAAKIRHQLSYEARRDLEAPLDTAQADLAAARARRAELEAAADAAAAASHAAEADVAGDVAKAADLRAAAEAAEAVARDKRRAASAAAAAAGEVKGAIAVADADAERADGVAVATIEAASLDQVDLPRLADPPTPGAGPAAAYDFSRLPRHLAAAAASSPRDAARVAADLRADIDARAASLARGAPNLKALDQYEAVKARERDQADEVDAARGAARAAADAYARLRARRHALFMAAFEHAAASVDDVFKDLTRSDAHPTGGSAHLSLDNADEPFAGGVKFTAMPPAKRYRDMDALSGGERTLSALALLFAVHSFRASPFFVLDEVDAALDAANVARVAAYVRARTRPGAAQPLQAVVISLKDGFYHHADTLVGVCRDGASGASATLTFDLERYGPPAAAV